MLTGKQCRTFLIASIYLLIVVSVTQAQYSGGSGTAEDPYQIATATDLIALGETPDDYNMHFILTADIDLDPNLPGGKVFDRAVIAPDTNDFEDWFQGASFSGVFDGNEHTISHLTIKGESYLGLFGQSDWPADIHNLGLEVMDVNGTGNYVGGLVGRTSGSLGSCFCSGSVNGSEDVGGLAGYSSGDIKMSHSRSTVTGRENVGGLVGGYDDTYLANTSSISTCYSISTVIGNRDVGGLVGENQGDIVLSYSAGLISGMKEVGGLVGGNYSRIVYCHCSCEVSGDELVGGLAGSNGYYVYDARMEGEIISSHSTGTVSGLASVGGLVGENDKVGKISESCSTCAVTGLSSVGGLAGKNLGSIYFCHNCGEVAGAELNVGGLVGTNGRVGRWDIPNFGAHAHIAMSYNHASVTGGENVGGLVGENTNGEIRDCYSAGAVMGEEAGGLVGHSIEVQRGRGGGTTLTSFWDVETSGQEASAGGTGLGTAEMQTASTFLEAGWDFVDETENGPNDVWKIVEGQTYPLLFWQKYGGGTGEPKDPYLIYTAEHLNALGAEPNDYEKCFKLMADIDLSGYEYDRAVIAPDVNDAIDPRWGYSFDGIPFAGFFDGNNCRISNLTIKGVSYLGLFGYLGSKAGISNLGLEAVDVNGIGDYVGGFVGWNVCGSVTASSSSGVVRGIGAVGGLAGENLSGIITTSYSTGDVSGDNGIGGLVGSNFGGGTIAQCWSSATSMGNEDSIGGLVGTNNGEIAMSYSTGDVNGNSLVGGLVGKHWIRYGMEDSIGVITGCYSSSVVNGNRDVGGLAGGVGLVFDWRYGFEGAWVQGDPGIFNMPMSFWDVETSGQSESLGGTGLTTAEMQTASTFLDAGWDFIDETENGTDDIWWIEEGQDYPRLWWEANR